MSDQGSQIGEKMKKKILAVALMVAMVTTLTACAKEAATAESVETKENESVSENVAEETDTAESYTIGISQFAEHPSLDNCKQGFLDGLAEEGIVEGENLTVLFDNAQTDTGTASTIADNFVSQGVDMICGIATPSAMSAYNSCMNTEIPTIFTAVSDPVASGLANEDGTPAGNVTGTSDYLAVSEQLKMIREVLPEATKIGIIYTTSETNSESTIAEYEKYAPEYGFEVVTTGISNVSEVELAASDLVNKVDCITNLTDNTVVSALQTELNAANKAGIPVFGSEVEQVKAGCVASMGLEYYELGVQTGKMAAKVLKGEATASEMKFETIKEASLYVNTAAAAGINLNLDKTFVNKAFQSFDEIIAE